MTVCVPSAAAPTITGPSVTFDVVADASPPAGVPPVTVSRLSLAPSPKIDQTNSGRSMKGLRLPWFVGEPPQPVPLRLPL